ncbi:hypothetical protein EZV62_023668 [Acer yangbiense]|uniref:CCHC-type domain-containing protein n=1 Tax=Acer yangbiense TaxID=1000413 RepID=A0A5C7H2B2_9ROSI|nr:hypothetical protein EZV62_023668 [Acer yangbiense]
MKLLPEFESARAGLINRTHVPSLDACLGELLREEQHLTSQLGIAQDAGGTEMEVEHIAKHCSKKFCNYCKKEGHIIKNCRVRPQNGSVPAFHTAVQSTFVPASSDQPNVLSSSSNLTPDSAALHDVRKYDGEQYIQIADGSTLPIIAVGNPGSSFTNVFMSLTLSANLIFVGQLVEENYSLHFDYNGCRVQEQALGQEIAKGPKVGRLFPLQSYSVPYSISVSCSAIANNSHF